MKIRKLFKILLIILLVLIVMFLLAWAGWEIYLNHSEKEKMKAPGNAHAYDVENVATVSDSPLSGKRILFLGSSVTKGSSAGNVSFADYLAQKHGIIADKEAVGATTLVDEFSIYGFLVDVTGDSYVTRLKNVDTSIPYDAVVVQLSTNDASQEKPLGTLSQSFDGENFDTLTVTGAIEYIIWYVRSTWDCPVIFYTGSYYEDTAYGAMVARLLEIQEKWDIGMIDLYNDTDFNSIDQETYNLYMYDPVHPTRAGYLQWWLPKIEDCLLNYWD